MVDNKVAIITGGASGMGLATAQALMARGGWHIHILDFNPAAGEAAVAGLGSSATFHQVDVTSYSTLGLVFKTIFQIANRIDFVFANAGIAETANFYAYHDTGIEPPSDIPQMDAVVDICVKGVISTAYLALHYFRLCPQENKGERNLVITSSCGGVYPSYCSPVYTATKHAVLGFMRSITPMFWRSGGIRVNAVLPGTVKTNLLSNKAWANFPEQFFTPVETIVDAVLIFVDGKDPKKDFPEGVLKGQAIECSGLNHYYQMQPEYSDAAMKAVMEATDIEVLQ